MSVRIDISSELKAAATYAQRIAGALKREDVRKVIGRAIAQTLKDHFYKLDAERANKAGGTRTHYYAQAAKSVQQPKMETDGLSVAIGQVGIGLRLFGGTVRPGKNTSWKTGRPTQWLSVPNSAIAHGRRTQEFDHSAGGTGNLHFVYFGPNLAALVENVATQITRGRNGVYRAISSTIGAVIFWLKKQITYAPDPRVLPTQEEMTSPAFQAASSYLGRIGARGGATS